MWGNSMFARNAGLNFPDWTKWMLDGRGEEEEKVQQKTYYLELYYANNYS